METKTKVKLTRNLILVIGIDLMNRAVFIEVERFNSRDEKGLFISDMHGREQQEKSLAF